MRWKRGQRGIERQDDLTLTRINGGASNKNGHKAEPTVSIVIPAKNEALNLPHVFSALDVERYEVILVDGDSIDDTVEVARSLCPDITVVGQTRKGKGNALACGFAVAQGDFIVMLDADGSTDPAEIPRFVEALKQGADFAKGSRFMPGAGSSDISRLRQVGNYFLNKIVNLIYGTRYTDLCYGYNAFRRECLSVMDLEVGRRQHRSGRHALGRRLRGRDPDQRAHRQGRPGGGRGPELRAQPPLRLFEPQRLLRRDPGAAHHPRRAQARGPPGRPLLGHHGPGRELVVARALHRRRRGQLATAIPR